MFFLAVAIVTCFRLSSPCADVIVTDVYDIRMTVAVPRVYDNMSSMGYRRNQSQKIDGKLMVEYSTSGEPHVYLKGVRNRTHLVGGETVAYEDSECEDVRWHYIGSNKTAKFSKPSVSFSVYLWPNYNVSNDIVDDNSMVLYFSGDGSSSTSARYRGSSAVQTIVSLKGKVVGTLGCGCADYGHISPTRIAGPYGPTDQVVDVAAVQGTWTARFNQKESGRIRRVQ